MNAIAITHAEPQTLRHALCRWLLGLVLLACFSLAQAVDRIPLAVLEDETGSETIARIADPARADDFRAISGGLSGGYTRKVHWLRFTLNAPEPVPGEPRRLLIEVHPPYLDDLQLYKPDPKQAGEFILQRTGDIHPYSSRPVPYRSFVFAVDFAEHLPTGTPQTFYLRLSTTSTSLLVLRTWKPDRFHDQKSGEYLLFGLYYGLLISLFLLHFWQWQWRHDATHRAFLAYVFTVFWFMFSYNGLVPEFLAPDHPNIGHWLVSACVYISVATAARFHYFILELDTDPGLFSFYLRAMFWLPILLSPFVLLGYFTEATRWLMIFTAPISLIGMLRSAILWHRKRAGSAQLMLAYCVSMAAMLAQILGTLGMLPGSIALLYGVQIGALGAILSFSFALSTRFRHLQSERDGALLAARDAQTAQAAEALVRQRQSALLSMLTHELKTPLAIIRLALSRLTGNDRAQSLAKEAITDITAVVDRCQSADQIDQGALKPAWSECRLSEILAEIQADQPRLQLSGVESLPVLRSDYLMLRTIFSNLIDNAIKYSPDDSPVTVDVTPYQETDPQITIRLRNRPGNAGLPDPEQLFNRYYRSAGAYARTGSGLGLYLVRELLGMLGGQITYHPPDADGWLGFEVRLPLKPE